jgi:hypothetical protein
LLYRPKRRQLGFKRLKPYSGVACELYDKPFLLIECVDKHHIGFCLLSQQPRRNLTERFIFFLQFGVLFPELFNRIFS